MGGSVNKAIEVAIVDDQSTFREVLRRSLRSHPFLHIVAEAADGLAAIDMVEHVRPQVVLMDINMPRMNGLEAAKVITSRYPDTRIIMLSLNDETEWAEISLRAGACRYLSKDCKKNDIVSAIIHCSGTPLVIPSVFGGSHKSAGLS